MAPATIPPLIRTLLLNFEPLFAAIGAVLLLTSPDTYLASTTRHAVVVVAPETTFLYTCIAGAWLYFAFVEAVVLRLTNDTRVWRALCAGMLLSDTAFCHAMAQAVDGWGEYLTLGQWTVEDWVALVTTVPFVLSRVLVVSGVGLREGKKDGKAE